MGLGSGLREALGWKTTWQLEKRHGDGAAYPGGIEAFKREVAPYEVLEFAGNLLMNVGGAAIWDLVTGGGVAVAFDDTNSYLGVGDDDTAEDESQTELIAEASPGNSIRKLVNGTYPQYVDRACIFQADFTGLEGNWTWNEIGTFNDATTGDMLNRKVQDLGTKTEGATWTLTETITLGTAPA
jgi:hypothetical protein